MIFATNPEIAKGICERGVIIRNGKIIADEAIDKVLTLYESMV